MFTLLSNSFEYFIIFVCNFSTSALGLKDKLEGITSTAKMF